MIKFSLEPCTCFHTTLGSSHLQHYELSWLLFLLFLLHSAPELHLWSPVAFKCVSFQFTLSLLSFPPLLMEKNSPYIKKIQFSDLVGLCRWFHILTLWILYMSISQPVFDLGFLSDFVSFPFCRPLVLCSGPDLYDFSPPVSLEYHGGLQGPHMAPSWGALLCDLDMQW